MVQCLGDVSVADASNVITPPTSWEEGISHMGLGWKDCKEDFPRGQRPLVDIAKGGSSYVDFSK